MKVKYWDKLAETAPPQQNHLAAVKVVKWIDNLKHIMGNLMDLQCRMVRGNQIPSISMPIEKKLAKMVISLKRGLLSLVLGRIIRMAARVSEQRKRRWVWTAQTPPPAAGHQASAPTTTATKIEQVKKLEKWKMETIIDCFQIGGGRRRISRVVIQANTTISA